MSVDATVETFAGLSGKGNVLVDFWGSNCAPCVALMPGVDELGRRYDGRLQLLKVDSGNKENRPIAWQLKVMGLPTYITLCDGVEVERLTGGEVTIQQIEAAIDRLVEGGAHGPTG
jgi:thioredoxin-like negative regulator of GroEL